MNLKLFISLSLSIYLSLYGFFFFSNKWTDDITVGRHFIERKIEGISYFLGAWKN